MWVKFLWFKEPTKNLRPMEILTPQKQNGCNRGNTCEVRESAFWKLQLVKKKHSVHLNTRECSQSICLASGKAQDSKSPFAVEGFVFVLYFWRKAVILTGEQVDNRDTRLIYIEDATEYIELQYNGIIFYGSNFLWCFNFGGFNFRGCIQPRKLNFLWANIC